MNIKDNKKSKQSINKIKNSICKMLKSVNHNQLTIKEICLDAGINRTTFYAHFDSIESALYQICEEYITKAYKIFLNTQIPYKDRLKRSIDIIYERKDFFGYVFNNVHDLEMKIFTMVENCFLDENYLGGGEQAKLSLAFIISGFIGVGKIYFNSKFSHMTTQQFADILCSTINFTNPYFMIK